MTIKATVLRDRETQTTPAEEVVAGDVVLLSAGSLVPADGVVLEARDFFLTLRPPETEFERGIRRLGYLLSEVMFVTDNISG